MDENEQDQELTPALIPIRTGTTIMIVLALLTLGTWALDWAVYATFLGFSIAWFLFFVVGTTYVFHKARQAGEWPSKEPK